MTAIRQFERFLRTDESLDKKRARTRRLVIRFSDGNMLGGWGVSLYRGRRRIASTRQHRTLSAAIRTLYDNVRINNLLG